MAARIEFDIALAHRMYAGADMFLMPSEFEPCGPFSDDFYALWHASCGCETGGLADSVKPYSQFTTG